MAIGILGGTFDPPHHGHLVLAETVRRRLKLAEIVFVPAGNPWLKSDQPVTPAAHRVAMVRLAIRGKPHFRLSLVEVERPGPTYTVDTIVQLKQEYTDELLFILGWDALSQLPRWREPDRLITLCRLVAIPRPGFPPPDLDALSVQIPGLSARVILLDEPNIDISATEIRRRISQNLSLDDLVPGPVADYIKRHRLYREDN